ncbi:MAG: bifunctional diaminohydroxyphosphoribosylaminopyrimidine deaminase/5-amino-6-(5-phosphoribosylamino)uracil reductase RibD [Corynebacterium sp.]|nr:bifunctional diaminohydroxyphosphoribosylaminopyrimidine deaminase/5-amino-6-(5-phosphoribosylamino)uracil reductase RibD [Corynebacterium sp.]
MSTPWGRTMTWEDWLIVAEKVAAPYYGTAYPNPVVGAVILDTEGRRIGAGYTRVGAHAEVMAIKSVEDKNKLKGATLVCTLEPCNHTGKTPPCTEAIIKAGIKRVVYAQTDPNPLAKGGSQTLSHAGVRVDFVPMQVTNLQPWLQWVRTGQPFIRAKIAQTMDGYVAAADGTSQWITSEESRNFAHEVRSRTAAIVIGSGTLEKDQPSLTARKANGALYARQPERIVMSSRDIEVPEGFHLCHDFSELFTYCKENGLFDILFEGGPGLITSALKEGIIDELHLYEAPLMLGKGQHSIGDLGIDTLDHALHWQVMERRPLGADQFTRMKLIQD